MDGMLILLNKMEPFIHHSFLLPAYLASDHLSQNAPISVTLVSKEKDQLEGGQKGLTFY